MTSLFVSGTIDGDHLTVTRVHRSTSPDGAVLVIQATSPNRRAPRAGDRLPLVRTLGGSYVLAPERAKPGATPRGKGLRVYLPAAEASMLAELARAADSSPADLVARLVRAACEAYTLSVEGAPAPTEVK